MAYMEKVIYGSVTMFRHKCPVCRNDILSNDDTFECDCGHEGGNKKVQKTTIEVITGRRGIIPARIKRQLNKKQGGKCYWCNRRFGTLYYKDKTIKSLRRHYDHKVPFSYEQRNRKKNWCIACNICNLFKSNFLFKKETECVTFLSKKWATALREDKINIITPGEKYA